MDKPKNKPGETRMNKNSSNSMKDNIMRVPDDLINKNLSEEIKDPVQSGVEPARLISRYPSALFFVFLAMMSFAYHYNTIIFSPPQSIHRWRQTDGASVALNYYHHGMQFFKPETHALTSDGSTTGYSAGEFPLLYFTVAILYKICGPDESIFRVFNMLIFFSGLYALFRIGLQLIRDTYYSILIPLILFTSPVAAYYGCNFLPDTAALALVFWGWFFFLRKANYNKEYFDPDDLTEGLTGKNYLFAVILFTMAGLLKVTMSISLVTILIIGIIWKLYPAGKRGRPGILVIASITGLMMIAVWYLYVIHFNKLHDSTTFLTSVKPWWLLDSAGRKELSAFILERNLHLYFSYNMLVFLFLSLLLILIRRKKIRRGFFIAVMMMLAGGVVYVNLWYTQFQYHDYYFIVLLAPLGLLLAAALMALRESYPHVYKSLFLKLAIFALLVFNVIHAREEVRLRYFGWKREAPVYEEYFDIKPYLESIGIGSDDRVLSIPDATNCYTLYMMDRPGNNLPGINEYTADAIRFYRSLGAKYLFVNDTALPEDSALKEFTGIEVGRKGNVRIFKLDR